MDPITIGASALASDEAKGLLSRVFGPSADVAGEHMASLLKRRLENSHKVAKAAERRIRSDIELQPVPMRVALRALDEGSYSDDEVVTEYVGGIIASSRMAKSGDLANTFVSIVSRLSTTHLTLHYHCYHAVKSMAGSEWINLFDGNKVQEKLSVFVNASEIERVSGALLEDESNTTELFSALKYLEREGLISVKSGGELQHVQKAFPAVQEAGIVFEPTVTGIELFMWGLGQGDRGVEKFFKVDTSDIRIADLPCPAKGVSARPPDEINEST